MSDEEKEQLNIEQHNQLEKERVLREVEQQMKQTKAPNVINRKFYMIM